MRGSSSFSRVGMDDRGTIVFVKGGLNHSSIFLIYELSMRKLRTPPPHPPPTPVPFRSENDISIVCKCGKKRFNNFMFNLN